MSNDKTTPEQVLQLAKEAMLATEGLKEFKAETKKKLDAFDVEKQQKLSDDIVKGLEESQKLRLSIEAEQKARTEMEKGLGDQIKALTDAGFEGFEKRFGTLESTIQRLTAGGEQGEIKALEKQWKKAFREFTKKENPNGIYFSDFLNGAPELKDLSVGSQPDGGFMVMPVFGPMVQKRVWETSPIRSIASQMTISTDAIEFPLDNDEAASGGWVGETQSRPNTGTPQITEQRIPVFEQYANPRMTQKLLDDASFDAEAWIQGKVADKFSRVENTAFVLGAGVKSPHGFLTYPNYDTPGAFQTQAIEQITSGSSGAITYDALIKIMGSLKDPYQANARWVMNRATMSALLTIKDTQNRPLLNPLFDRNAGAEANIMGKPVTFAADMPVPAAASKAIAYGDFKEGYLIVDRTGIRILRDPYTAKPYVQFYTTKRVGGDVVNFESLKILVLS